MPENPRADRDALAVDLPPAATVTSPADRCAAVVRDLRAMHPADDAQRALREEYVALVLDRGGDALRKGGGPEHLTASTFVLSEDLSHVLLTLHRKAGAWLQVGGHVEDADATLAAAARREAEEESGFPDVVLASEVPVDVDRHTLGERFSCRAHWDVGFVALAPRGSAIVVSDESDDVAWWPVDDLPPDAQPDLRRRLPRAVAAVVASRREV
ncbi:NUDIX domain-containing protein [Litorihabitans aurantiacus]|uniref:NUDIX hydrolase n=1 Tax=Litorihabitans aurantiacus TaxID=1930061 RepID=A0AA37UQT0_9MICO|nr:NUDIX domain-containing protein [Litorihabitans aurantiacus]GMA30833.1 NUDIX hydrolase [Litorihabitans aurantiacus]